jgi:uncharacterized membrane protein YphA (DoxX/SURF4 family)
MNIASRNGPYMHAADTNLRRDAAHSDHRRCAAVTRMAGTFAFLAGLITLVGWFANAPRLTDWLNSGISMMPNTAICAISTGLALMLLPSGHRQLVSALGSFVGLVGAATLFEYLTGVEHMRQDRRVVAACWAVRLALAASFLSAVADRLGAWGPPGADGVAWGSVQKYEEYVARLNWFLPPPLVSPVGWAATSAEVLLAAGLLVGWRVRWVALAAGLLLAAFAAAMAVSLGLKPPLDYSVPSAADAALLLAAISPAGKLAIERRTAVTGATGEHH